MLRNGLEPWHLLILAIVVIVLFGSKKLPDSARALGQSLRILKSETKAMKEDGTPPGAAPRATAAPAAAQTEPVTPRTTAADPDGATPPHRPVRQDGAPGR
ncbi:Sec-independent protein translocase subunit TatA [Streptomyces sp. HB132]|uniref:Sec-independent protein translocase subunit TatA n=1 Tax=Streptomyces sp. HB132 TaxID=767388 RepID=UPI001961117B|nr:Sec-independent protein translocase subunit TatA [Streptomyces sp. HB132]MBM7442239.1 sec-independent protein translocase protein TatA [Streptomyces sp. HB132]